MLSIERTTRLKPDVVIDKAVAFFGPKGLGMDLVERDSCCVRFSGGGGYVLVQTEDLPEQKRRRVTAEGREWEIPIKEFMKHL